MAERIEEVREAFELVPTALTVAVGVLGDSIPDGQASRWKPVGGPRRSGATRTRTRSHTNKLSLSLISLLASSEGRQDEREDARGVTLSEMWSPPRRSMPAVEEHDLRMEDGVRVDAQYSLVDEDMANIVAALSGEPQSGAHATASLTRIRGKIGGLVDAFAAILQKMDPDMQVLHR